MKSRRKMLAIVLSICAAIGIIAAATASADHRGGPRDNGNHNGNGDGNGHGNGSITGFPDKINEFDLNGYQIVTTYPLGANAGNTFQQTYTDTGVTAFATAGPDVGGGNFVSTYTALPVGHDELFVTWFQPDGSTTDVFLMNFKTGIVSDVAPPQKQPVSLGTVKIIKYGSQPLP
jgi:hypothetical protein